MARRVRVSFDKIRVHRSEDYGGPFGVGGEPGKSAEWMVRMKAASGRNSERITWHNNEVRDHSEHVIDRRVDVALEELSFPLTIDISGREIDDGSKNDYLPTRAKVHQKEPAWESGASYEISAGNDEGDYEYTVSYSIRYLDPPPQTQIAPGHGVFGARVHYAGLWSDDSEDVVALTGVTAAELNSHASQLWGHGGRLRQLQPFTVGGQVRYNALWDYSGIRQLWNIDCSADHFVRTTGETWSWGRPASVQAFVAGGELRYAVLWNEGQHGQRWHHNCSEADFRAITGETWSWARPYQVQPFMHQDELRYSCLWNAGQHSQLWHPNCSAHEVGQLTGDNWSWARPFRIHPILVDGQMRYSGLWNAGQHSQLWNFDCDADQVAINTRNTESWGRPAQLLAAAG